MPESLRLPSGKAEIVRAVDHGRSDGFKGKIIGNGHKMSNITVNQGNTSVMRGGLFGGIDAGAEITGVTFENITFNMNAGSLKAGASFGLLAGTISNEAVLSDITVSGAFNISSKIYPDTDYSLGILSGNIIDTGIDASSITCQVTDDTEKLSIELQDNGQITLAFAESFDSYQRLAVSSQRD